MRKLKLAEHYSDFDDINNMLYDYILELNQIDSNVTVRDKIDLAHEYFVCIDTHYYLLFEDDEEVGFAIVGHHTNCHPMVEQYIEEFYIKPEYRRKGAGSEFAKLLLNEKKSVCYYELKKNKQAKAFWNKVFEGDEWEDISYKIKDDIHTPEWLDWYVQSKVS